MERPTMPPPSPPRSRGWGSILIVILATSGLVSFLLLAPIGFLGFAILVGSMVLTVIIGLHYLIWGRWLTRTLQESAAEMSDDE